MLTACDASHTEGTVGLRMYRASADFDNVIVSPSPKATIFAQDFNVDGEPGDWSYRTGTYDVNQGIYRQSSTVGDAKSIAGAMTEDSIVRARVRPTSLLSGNSWGGAARAIQVPE